MGRGRDRGSQRGSSLGHEEMGAKGVREGTLAGGHEVAIRGLGALWRHISNTPGMVGGLALRLRQKIMWLQRREGGAGN